MSKARRALLTYRPTARRADGDGKKGEVDGEGKRQGGRRGR